MGNRLPPRRNPASGRRHIRTRSLRHRSAFPQPPQLQLHRWRRRGRARHREPSLHPYPIEGGMIPRCDVLIVGARAAGAATALLLARAGLGVVVIDRGQRGTDTLSTHALMRPAVMQLRRWGALPRLVAAGTPPIRGSRFYYGDGVTTVGVKNRDGIDALFAPRRTVLDRVLVDMAADAGARVLFGTSLREYQRRLGGVTAIITGTSGTSTIEATLIVG